MSDFRAFALVRTPPNPAVSYVVNLDHVLYAKPGEGDASTHLLMSDGNSLHVAMSYPDVRRLLGVDLPE